MKRKLGRPFGTFRNKRLHEIMKERGISRAAAYKWLQREQLAFTSAQQNRVKNS